MGRRGRNGSIGRVGIAVVLASTLCAGACAGPIIGHGAVGGGGPRAGAERQGPLHCDQPSRGAREGVAEPAEVDLDGRAVTDAIRYADARGAQSVRVYRHGCLVGRSGLDQLNERTPMASWSMTKGVVSLLVGRAVTQGHMGVDDPIGAHLDGLSHAHASITVRHLLTMTSGLRFAWANDLNAAATGDSAALVLTRPFESEPGTRYVYAQTTVTALVSVLEAAVGEDLQAYAARELFEPLGITRGEWIWQRDGSGRSQGFAFLDMSPRAFGRLGSLMLEQGRWQDRQLIDPGYIREGAIGTAANPGYGFLWRTNHGERFRDSGYVEDDWVERRWLRPAPPDTFGMSGLFEQNVIVIPSLDIVVVRMGLPQQFFADPMGTVSARQPSWDHRFLRILMGGVSDVDVPDPGDWTPDPTIEIDPRYILGIGF